MKDKNKSVFLDRDGVINLKSPEGDYIKKWDEFRFLPGVIEALGRLNQAGYLIMIITNQRGIAKGLMTEEDLKEIHAKMSEEIKKSGTKIDGIYYCPHSEEDHCNCRKPKIGLFLEAKKDHHIEMGKSYLVGDSESDILAGRRAGCKTILINRKLKKYNILTEKVIKCDFMVNNLSEAINVIMKKTL